MTSTAWHQGATNALICAVGLFLTWLAITFIISLALNQTFAASSKGGFAAIWLLAYLGFLGSWLYGRAARGRILLDCGPHPKRWLFLLNFSLCVSVGLIPSPSSTPAPDGIHISAFGFASSFGVYWLIIAFGRLQLSEHGIWQYWGLLRWSKVGSYRWTDDSTLLLSASGWFAFLRGALPVAPEHWQAVDDLLTQFCGARQINNRVM